MARRQGAPTGRTGRRPLAACGETQAAFERRSIPAEPLRFAPFCVAFRSKYTRYSSLTRLVSRAPRRSRRSPGFHHRLLGRHSPPEAGGGKNLQFRAGAGRSGYCDMFPSNRLRYCDMFTPQIGLLRHVPVQPTPLLRHVHPADPATATCSPPDRTAIPLLRHVHPADRATATCSHPADPATATCSPRRSGYCDMFAPSRPRYCDMFTPQIGLLRHVRTQPTPLLRHVHPADRATATATATCSPRRSRYCDMFDGPADRATATCSAPSRPRYCYCDMFTRRSGYCDMFAPSRPRYPADPATPSRDDMFTPQIGLLRHVRAQPTPLLRHVHPADPATATCPSPGRLVRNGVSGQRRRAVTGGNLQLDFSTLPPRRRKNGGRFPSE